jgi:hypothetical protein
MKCAICKEKEFSVVIESHKPLEEQPWIVCFECLCKMTDVILIKNLEKKISSGKRCSDMKKYSVSWFHTSNLTPFTLSFPWWVSGTRMGDGAESICAAIVAQSEEEVMNYITSIYDTPPPDIEWRLIREMKKDESPFSERFPKADWMKWPEKNI